MCVYQLQTRAATTIKFTFAPAESQISHILSPKTIKSQLSTSINITPFVILLHNPTIIFHINKSGTLKSWLFVSVVTRSVQGHDDNLLIGLNHDSLKEITQTKTILHSRLLYKKKTIFHSNAKGNDHFCLEALKLFFSKR